MSIHADRDGLRHILTNMRVLFQQIVNDEARRYYVNHNSQCQPEIDRDLR